MRDSKRNRACLYSRWCVWYGVPDRHKLNDTTALYTKTSLRDFAVPEFSKSRLPWWSFAGCCAWFEDPLYYFYRRNSRCHVLWSARQRKWKTQVRHARRAIVGVAHRWLQSGRKRSSAYRTNCSEQYLSAQFKLPSKFVSTEGEQGDRAFGSVVLTAGDLRKHLQDMALLRTIL